MNDLRQFHLQTLLRNSKSIFFTRPFITSELAKGIKNEMAFRGLDLSAK